MAKMWFECSHDVKLRALHKMVHEREITEDELSGIMLLLGYEPWKLLVYDPGVGPSSVRLYRT